MENISLQGKNNEFLVQYLGHSGWIVKTQNHFILFDYVQQIKDASDKSINKFHINPSELELENVYVFVSHGHDDHYDDTILNWSGKIKCIKYIFGHDIPKRNFISVAGNQEIKVDDLAVSTIYATDDGVGFLVKVDGLSIVHLGDHAEWVPELEEDFNRQIDYLANIDNNVGLLFIPVARSIGVRTQSITKGVLYTVDKLNPRLVFPMHGGGKEHLYNEFNEECGKKLLGSKIICAEKPGDRWRFDYVSLLK